MSPSRVVVVLGSTASGKSAVAMACALGRPTGEVHIIAADAMQVYRGMDIGTAKPTEADRAAVTHHGLDLGDPSERFTVTRWLEAVAPVRARLAEAGIREIVVGGTGLYVTALVDGLSVPGEWPDLRAELEAEAVTAVLWERLGRLDPVSASRIEPGNRRRIVRALEVCVGSGRPFSSFGDGVAAFPPIDVVQVGLRWNREALRRRIAARAQEMFSTGLVEEVAGLLARPGGVSPTAMQALGYKEVVEHLEGRCSLEAAMATVVLRTGQFAVRQERWYRRDPRIEWVDVEADPVEEAGPLVRRMLA